MRAIVLNLALALLTGCTAGPSAVSSSAGKPEVLALSASDGRGSLSYEEEAAPLPGRGGGSAGVVFFHLVSEPGHPVRSRLRPRLLRQHPGRAGSGVPPAAGGDPDDAGLWDYTLTDGSYALTVDSVEQSADGALSVRLEEDSTESFCGAAQRRERTV